MNRHRICAGCLRAEYSACSHYEHMLGTYYIIAPDFHQLLLAQQLIPVIRRQVFPIRVIGYNCWWRVPMTTTTTPNDAAAAERPKLIRTYRTRAYLSGAGHVQLDDVLAQQCLLYNAALEERKTAWKQHQSASLSPSRADRLRQYAKTSRASKDRSTGAYKTPLSKDSTERSRHSIAVSRRARPQDIRVSSPPGAGRLSRCIPVMPDVCSLMRARVKVWCV